jgi:ATP-dependent Clp protease protease subunit
MKKFWNWIHDDGGGRILRLEGPIDSENFWGDEITPQMFREDLEAEEGDVTVWINSPGGNVFAAAEIYTMLKDYAGKVTVKVASLAASAASVVAMAGDTVQMSPTALLMLHDLSTVAMGNTRDMEKAIAALNEVKEAIVNAYAAKSGLRRGRIADLMSEETWLNAKKAVELGFADEVLYDGRKPEDDKDPEKEDALPAEAQLFSTRVMDMAIAFAKAHRCYKVILQSGVSRTGAHQFYQRKGFDGASKKAFEMRLD